MDINEANEHEKQQLLSIQQSFLHVFNKESAFAREVLKDLEEFCRGTETTFHPDQRVHAVLEGRREVWLRIKKYIDLSSEELWLKRAKVKKG